VRTRRGRILALAAVIVATGLAVSGCAVVSFVNQVGTKFSDSAAKPKVGQCWNATYDDVSTTPTSGRTTGVPCAESHQSYTVAVETVKGSFTGSWVGTPGHVSEEVDAAAGAACVARQKQLMPNLTRDAVLLLPTYKLPSVAAWKRGARWVRCDVSEIEVGSPIAAPKLADLPTDFGILTATLAATPATFAYCVNDPNGDKDGPTSSGAVYADCTGSPDWTRRVTETIPANANGDYPSVKSIGAFAVKVCSDKYRTKTVDTFYYYPSKSGWADGDHLLDCWTSVAG
jgi:hypothetical protein